MLLYKCSVHVTPAKRRPSVYEFSVLVQVLRPRPPRAVEWKPGGTPGHLTLNLHYNRQVACSAGASPEPMGQAKLHPGRAHASRGASGSAAGGLALAFCSFFSYTILPRIGGGVSLYPSLYFVHMYLSTLDSMHRVRTTQMKMCGVDG